ncbi:hypothetical protein HIM_03327 [Hirsutella minnesotensis 3608]|uniref:Heme haloperoxidase family profile domain-containing protein n=1 Tax=Hirsutella minnesotensis 3608 TaxID=1043627 RepID=A0A0F7ZM62_9HYPO|nr:hypothetical protein HIM_03327 [Hirsutella minnesotensis 3608]
MRRHSRCAAILGLLASCYSLVEAYSAITEPRLNINDPRFKKWSPPGKGDLRSGCPGLNSLSNHGFLPHNGRRMNMTDVTLACFFGLGMSPETCTIITLSGLLAADAPQNLVFDLPAVDLESWEVEHDISMSRKDKAEGDAVRFDKEIWDNSLTEMNKCGENVDALCLGRVKVARILDEGRRNPKTNYDKLSAGHGAVENARLLLTLGNGTHAPAKYIRTLFEQERLPYHLGWRPRAYTAGVFEVIQVAADSLQVPNQGLTHTSDGDIESYQDIIKTLSSNEPHFLEIVAEVVRAAGFREESIYASLQALAADLESEEGQTHQKILSPNGRNSRNSRN